MLNRGYEADLDDVHLRETAFGNMPSATLNRDRSTEVEKQPSNNATTNGQDDNKQTEIQTKPRLNNDDQFTTELLETLRPHQTQRSTSTSSVQCQPATADLSMSATSDLSATELPTTRNSSVTSPNPTVMMEHTSEVATLLSEVLDSDGRYSLLQPPSEPEIEEEEEDVGVCSSSSSVMSFYETGEVDDNYGDNYTEQRELDTFLGKKKHYFILSSAGKPIYSMNGSDELITGYMGIFQAIVSYFETTSGGSGTDDGHKSAQEQLKSVKAGNTLFVFSVNDPLILIAVDKLGQSEYQLRAQLDVLYAQILSTLTKSQLAKVFKGRTNFDLRQLLGGTEVFLNALTREMSFGSPGILLGSLECLRLRKSIRTKINSVLIERRTKSLLYGMIVADSRLASVIRPRRHSLHPPDLHLVFSMLFNTTSFSKGGEHWVPICLPKFNSTGFLYAYIYFFAPECAIVLISPDKNSFFEMRECKELVLADLHAQKLAAPITTSLTRGRFHSSDIPGASIIRHFLYKSKANVQFVMPAHHTGDDAHARHKLMVLYHQLHGAVHSRYGHIKVYHTTSGSGGLTGLAWVTPSFEMYCVTGGSGVTKEAVSAGVRAIVGWVKQHEERLFVIGGAVF